MNVIEPKNVEKSIKCQHFIEILLPMPSDWNVLNLTFICRWDVELFVFEMAIYQLHFWDNLYSQNEKRLKSIDDHMETLIVWRHLICQIQCMEIISFIVDQSVERITCKCQRRQCDFASNFNRSLQIVMENVLKNQFSSAVFHMIRTG